MIPTNIQILEDGETVSFDLNGNKESANVQQDQEGMAYFLYYLPDGSHNTFYLDAITENN